MLFKIIKNTIEFWINMYVLYLIYIYVFHGPNILGDPSRLQWDDFFVCLGCVLEKGYYNFLYAIKWFFYNLVHSPLFDDRIALIIFLAFIVYLYDYYK